MANGFEITWYGDDLLTAVRLATPEVLLEGAEELIDLAAAAAPVRTGELASSAYVANSKRIIRRGRPHRGEIQPADEQTVVAGFSAFYARMVEFGTRHSAAKPFIRPALDNAVNTIVEKVVAGYRERLD